MTASENRRAKRGARAMDVRAAGTGIAVNEEQRRRLAECCAFFLASRFRRAAPGDYRTRDLSEAEASIDAIIRKRRPK